MPINPSFSCWLGTLLGHPEDEVQRLLDDESALHFLITWSIFESKCFAGFIKVAEIENFAKTACPTIVLTDLKESTEHFHTRYQCSDFLKNLMHGKKNDRLSAILNKPLDNICDEESLYLLIFVIYRYRNNIFHGNKGVKSWLNYREQIQHCIRVMQVMISQTESNNPTMKTETT